MADKSEGVHGRDYKLAAAEDTDSSHIHPVDRKRIGSVVAGGGVRSVHVGIGVGATVFSSLTFKSSNKRLRKINRRTL